MGKGETRQDGIVSQISGTFQQENGYPWILLGEYWEFLSNADKRDHRRRQVRSREVTRKHGKFQKIQDRLGAEEMGVSPGAVLRGILGGKGCGQVTVYIERREKGVTFDAAWGWSDGTQHGGRATNS